MTTTTAQTKPLIGNGLPAGFNLAALIESTNTTSPIMQALGYGQKPAA